MAMPSIPNSDVLPATAHDMHRGMQLYPTVNIRHWFCEATSAVRKAISTLEDVPGTTPESALMHRLYLDALRQCDAILSLKVPAHVREAYVAEKADLDAAIQGQRGRKI